MIDNIKTKVQFTGGHVSPEQNGSLLKLETCRLWQVAILPIDVVKLVLCVFIVLITLPMIFHENRVSRLIQKLKLPFFTPFLKGGQTFSSPFRTIKLSLYGSWMYNIFISIHSLSPYFVKSLYKLYVSKFI